MKDALRAALFCIAAAAVGGCSAPQPAEINGELIPADESALTATALGSLQTVARDERFLGCVRANVAIDRKLPVRLKHGVFAKARTYSAWIRLSRGVEGRDMTIELAGVDGPRLIPDGARTQDLVMTDFPVFFVADVAGYAAYASRTSPVARILAAANGQTVDNLFTQRYFSMTPYRLGSTYVKFSARPAPCPVTSHLGSADTGDPNGLRAQMVSDLSRGDACFELQLQPRTDPASMPIEDASALWDESKAPFVDAAFVDIQKQRFDSAAQQKFCEENLSFTPWHGTTDFRPVGGINRLRLFAYRAGLLRPTSLHSGDRVP